jgi:hypothetical protein
MPIAEQDGKTAAGAKEPPGHVLASSNPPLAA